MSLRVSCSAQGKATALVGLSASLESALYISVWGSGWKVASGYFSRGKWVREETRTWWNKWYLLRSQPRTSMLHFHPHSFALEKSMGKPNIPGQGNVFTHPSGKPYTIKWQSVILIWEKHEEWRKVQGFGARLNFKLELSFTCFLNPSEYVSPSFPGCLQCASHQAQHFMNIAVCKIGKVSIQLPGNRWGNWDWGREMTCLKSHGCIQFHARTMCATSLIERRCVSYLPHRRCLFQVNFCLLSP